MCVWLTILRRFLTTSRNWCHWSGGLASTVCDLSVLFGVTLPAMAGTYTVQLARVQRRVEKGQGGRPGGLSNCPPRAASDRPGTSGQIWEGNVLGGNKGDSSSKGEVTLQQSSFPGTIPYNNGETWLQDKPGPVAFHITLDASHVFSVLVFYDSKM